MVPNYPNYFTCLGPGGPTSHGSFVPVTEWHANYIIKMIRKMQKEAIRSYDPKIEAVRDQWVHTQELMKRLIWSGACPSWFKNGNLHGPVLAVHPGSRLHWFETMAEPRYEDYNIEYLHGNRFAFWGNGFSEIEAQGGDFVWYLRKPWCNAEIPNLQIESVLKKEQTEDEGSNGLQNGVNGVNGVHHDDKPKGSLIE